MPWETALGQLIMVLQFVGFVGGWENPGSLPPATAAVLCAALTTWVTFLPSFLFILVGGPHIEKIFVLPWLSAALSGITASVVGVILNLGVKFSIDALWPATSGRFDAFVATVAVGAFVAMRRFKMGLIPVIGCCALLGLGSWLLF
jgi:chromate transporter